MKKKRQSNMNTGSLKEEGLKLFNDISESSKHVTALVKKIISNLGEDFSVSDGISLLDIKGHVLLSYLTDLTYLMTLKSSGQSIEADPAIGRLIEGRVVLERVKPIDQKLKYQIDKLIKTASTGAVDDTDPSQFRANPSNMMSKFDSDDNSDEDEEGELNDGKEKKGSKRDGKRDGVYVPPKVAPAYYDGDETKAEREKRLLERARKYALTSSVIQDLKEEYLETPVEVKSTNSLTQKVDAYQKRKQEYEETYFTRLPVTKADKQRNKRISTLGLLGEEITKFEDISALEGTMPILKSKKKRKNKTQGNKKGKKKRKNFR